MALIIIEACRESPSGLYKDYLTYISLKVGLLNLSFSSSSVSILLSSLYFCITNPLIGMSMAGHGFQFTASSISYTQLSDMLGGNPFLGKF